MNWWSYAWAVRDVCMCGGSRKLQIEFCHILCSSSSILLLLFLCLFHPLHVWATFTHVNAFPTSNVSTSLRTRKFISRIKILFTNCLLRKKNIVTKLFDQELFACFLPKLSHEIVSWDSFILPFSSIMFMNLLKSNSFIIVLIRVDYIIICILNRVQNL